jgi:N-acetylglucosamine kinase-like BadF-type ATPase
MAFDTRTGKLCGPIYGRAINLHRVPKPEFIRRLDATLLGLAVSLGLRGLFQFRQQVSRIVVALPGAGRQSDFELACDFVRSSGWDSELFQILDDTWAGLYEMTLSEKGICAFAGTGASVCVSAKSFTPGDVQKVDGWGPVIGDYGSGFQLVVDFFRLYRRRLDKGEHCALFERILAEHAEITGSDNVQMWVDLLFQYDREDWSAQFAKLGRTISAAAELSPLQDPDARDLVVKTARDMAYSINIAVDRFGAEALPLVLQGGLFLTSELYRETVCRNIQSHRGNILLGHLGPVFGALLYGMGLNSEFIQFAKNQVIALKIDALAEREAQDG